MATSSMVAVGTMEYSMPITYLWARIVAIRTSFINMVALHTTAAINHDSMTTDLETTRTRHTVLEH